MSYLAQSIFGNIPAPTALSKYSSDPGVAVGQFINLAMNVLIVIAGVYAVINLIAAGYSFMSAGDDSKKVAGAWQKIWQTLLGLAVAAGAFVLAAIFSLLIYGDANTILMPIIPTP